MNIRPRNIPKFQSGGSFNLSEWIKLNPEYYKWYSSIYPNALVLQGSPLKQRNDLWNKNQLSSSHYTTDDLLRSAYNNYLYTNDYDARSEDLTRWGESLKDFGTISDRDFVNRYNNQAQTIRSAREAPQTYNKKGYTDTNRTFRNMFWNRSRQGTNTPLYTIGYLDNIEDIEGTSTWQRRMDRYEKPFNEDTPEGLKNRTFYIKRPNGTVIKVYKKENGDIALFDNPSENPVQLSPKPNVPEKLNLKVQVPTKHKNKYGFDWDKIRGAALKIFGSPDLYAFGRLAGNLINNERVYDEQLKGISPVLRQTYNTHRQVVGDEATKLAYYRRAAQGQNRAARPFTSDADRLMAYQFESKRIGDELKAQGDLADNQEIRRTSDESNQHQWANTQRATEVANANIASMNLANALKHNLLALKHSALWSSIDNFLQGIEYRKRLKQEKERAIQDQIWLLTEQNNLENNPEYIALQKAANDAWDKATKEGKTPSSDENVKKALLNLKNWKTLYLILMLLSRPIFAKSGTKITHKKKDDLLYKSTKDVVEHFRKMSKISSDALNRKQPKIEKLTSHPKGKTKKYLLGGVAPFTVYKPVALGGETTTSTQTGTSSTKSSSEKEGQDLLKELFKALLVEGLPSDVNGIFQAMNNLMSRRAAFGQELSTEDIASMYLLSVQQINTIKFNKAQFDAASKSANDKDAILEFAVDSYGRLAVLDKEGNVSFKKWDDIKDKLDKYNPLTNNDLLNLRAYSPDLAFNSRILEVVNNGIGMSKIADFLKAQLPKLGSSELTIEGYTKLDSNMIRAGLLLLKDAPAGDYKMTLYNKDLLKQALMALSYLASILPNNMKSVLLVHASILGISTKDMLLTLIGSQMNEESRIEFDAVTGKASDKGLGSGGKGDISSNPLLAIQREIGGMYLNYSLVTKDSNTKLSVNGTFYSLLPKISEDMSIDKMLSVSGIGGIIQGKRGITFGNLEIKPEDLKHIMYSNNGGMVVTLPCKIVNGIKLVNLDVVETYEKAEQKALQVNSDRNSPQFIQALALELKNEHLDSLLDSNGLPNKNMFGQFLVVEAYTSDKTKFDINSKYVEKIENPDGELELRMSKALSTDNKKSDYALDVKDHWTIFEGTWDDIYKGTVFIPLNNNPNAALNTWGNSAKVGQTTELEELYLISNKSSKFNGNNTLE